MTPFAWLLGLVLPACGGVGVDRVPPPPPLDIARLERPASPNTALAAPADTGTPPDIVSPDYKVPAQRLLAAVERIAAAEPRTWPLGPSGPATAQWVVRSAILNFPDIVAVEVLPRGQDTSTLALYSRSIYGRSDFGVNRRRVEAWLAALRTSLNSER